LFQDKGNLGIRTLPQCHQYSHAAQKGILGLVFYPFIKESKKSLKPMAVWGKAVA